MTRRAVLLVEPDRLLRWSLATYLGRWFRVLEADSKLEAVSILDGRSIDAIVLSNELTTDDADAIVRKIISQDTCARIVRVIVSAYEEPPLTTNAITIEKPFELAELGRLLGADVTVRAGKSLPLNRVR